MGGSDITDLDGHGTFVAGLISAIDGNGLGIKGVAGNTPLYGIRAPTLLVSEIADAIVWAVDNGARVINLSLGGDERSAVVTSAIDYALDRNVLVVAAAGNSGDADNSAVYPAADIGGVQGGFSRGLSVAAVRPDLQHAAFSTSNDFVSVAAPGAAMGDCRFGVFSTIPASSGVTSWDEPFSCAVVYGLAHVDAGRWAYAAGTSFSASIVSGIAALALAVNPGLRNDQLATVLKRSASGSPDAGWNQRTGWGVVNAARAVGLAQRFDMLPTQRRVEGQAARPSLARQPEHERSGCGRRRPGAGRRDSDAGDLERRRQLRGAEDPSRHLSGRPDGSRSVEVDTLASSYRVRRQPQLPGGYDPAVEAVARETAHAAESEEARGQAYSAPAHVGEGGRSGRQGEGHIRVAQEAAMASGCEEEGALRAEDADSRQGEQCRQVPLPSQAQGWPRLAGAQQQHRNEGRTGAGLSLTDETHERHTETVLGSPTS